MFSAHSGIKLQINNSENWTCVKYFGIKQHTCKNNTGDPNQFSKEVEIFSEQTENENSPYQNL